MIAAIYASKSTDQAGVGPGRGARTREGKPDEYGDRHDAGVLRLPGEAHPEGGVRGHAGPGPIVGLPEELVAGQRQIPPVRRLSTNGLKAWAQSSTRSPATTSS